MKTKKQIKAQEKVLTLDEVFAQMTVASTSTPGLNNVVLTPLSSEACLRHGINPDYLRKRNFETFYEPDQTDIDIQRLKYETYDRRRHELMDLARVEKMRLEKNSMCDKSVSSSTMVSLTPSGIFRDQERTNSTLLETEEKRLKKSKEKQKRELLQMLHFETKMENIQVEMREKAEKEALLEEKKKIQKQKQERRDAEERRLRELRRKAKEDAEEDMHRIAARQRSEKERQFELEKEEQLAESKRRLRKLEEERDKKRELQILQTVNQQEQKRIETEKKLQARQLKERERRIRMEKKRAMDQYELDRKREQAVERIAQNKEVARQREEERTKAVMEKRIKSEMQQKLVEESRERELELTRKEREAMNRKREFQAKLARDREEEMKESLLKKFNEDEENVAKLKEIKEKDAALLKEERDLHMELKRENVERIKRMQEYRRLETMRKVSENDERTEEILRTREELAKSRHKNAVQAKIRRDKLMQTLEKSKSSGGKEIRKILAQLSNDDNDFFTSEGSEKKSKKTKKVQRMSLNKKEVSAGTKAKTKSDMPGKFPPAIIDIVPPPEAPSLLARIAEKSEKVHPYVSPYASSTSPYAVSR